MFGWLRKRQSQGQSQEGPGLAIQAGQNVTVNLGNLMTVTEVRNIALDVFKANLLEYRGIAQQAAMQRGETITDKFINKLQEENPAGIQQAQTPDFQDALFTVQKEFAKANDEDLGDLLVDLLVDRTKQSSRDLLQLVLSESLTTAPKLTAGQIATLTIVFMMRHVQFGGYTHAELRQFWAENVGPFVGLAAVSTASFGQLEFTGCGSISMGQHFLADLISQVNAGHFRKGFPENVPTELQIPFLQYPTMYSRCSNDISRLQIRAINHHELGVRLDAMNLSIDDRAKFVKLFDEGAMNGEEIRAKTIEIAPFLEPLFSIWDTSGMKHFMLTSVGMAIGHANAKRITKKDVAPLSIWIN